MILWFEMRCSIAINVRSMSELWRSECFNCDGDFALENITVDYTSASQVGILTFKIYFIAIRLFCSCFILFNQLKLVPVSHKFPHRKCYIQHQLLGTLDSVLHFVPPAIGGFQRRTRQDDRLKGIELKIYSKTDKTLEMKNVNWQQKTEFFFHYLES